MSGPMRRSLVSYAALLVVFAALVAWILHLGTRDFPQAATIAPSAPLVAFGFSSPLAQVLLQILVIVLLARGAGVLFTKIGQPAVIGEMAVGIALGPSAFGALAPGIQKALFPASSMGTLSMLSQVGIVLFMFAVGMELDLKLLKKKADLAILISHMSIVVPFLLGTASALWLYRDFGSGKPFVPFALFMGISMSITAFPVLARIIQERGLSGTLLGNTAITCAAVDDATAWCGLALIVAIAESQGIMSAVLTVGLTGLFFTAAVFLIRPALRRMAERLPDVSHPGKGVSVVILATIFGCALVTEAIGIHALFGAFVAGIAMPKREEFRQFFRERLEYLSSLFLLPIFFAFTGLRTQIGLLTTLHDWMICFALLALAVVGKFGGSFLASRWTGLTWRDSLAMGALMNTRGLVELIALNLGLDLGLLTPKVFAMLVLMALITTFSTGPIISLLGFGIPRTRQAAGTTSERPGDAY